MQSLKAQVFSHAGTTPFVADRHRFLADRRSPVRRRFLLPVVDIEEPTPAEPQGVLPRSSMENPSGSPYMGISGIA